MTTLVRATYDHGVLKLREPLPLLENQQVAVLVTSLGQWEKAFRALLAAVHARTRRFSFHDIERDITSAARRVRRRQAA